MTEWRQLVVHHNAPGWGEGFVAEFWTRAFSVLEQAGSLRSLVKPDDQPSFHVRFTGLPNALEVFRLRASNWDTGMAAAIEASPPANNLVSAYWAPLDAPFSQSNRFLTFLQACSMLRVVHGINDPRDLTQVTNGVPHDDCPHCLAAYAALREQNKRWAVPLRPWLDHLDTMHGIAQYRGDHVGEYGHWFGHIISHRGIPLHGPFKN